MNSLKKQVGCLVFFVCLIGWVPALFAQAPILTVIPTVGPTMTPTPLPEVFTEFSETFEGAYPPALWLANGAERIDTLSHSVSHSILLEQDGDWLVTPFMKTAGNQLQFFYRVTDSVMWRMLRLEYSTNGVDWTLWWKLSCTPNYWFRKQLDISTFGAERVKIRFSWDTGNDAGALVYLDDVSLSALPSRAAPAPVDFDGDGVSDLGLYWPEGGTWYAHCSGGVNPDPLNYGWSAAMPVPGDYDGDQITDRALFWPEGGLWYIYSSSFGPLTPINYGWSEMIPVPADYDGDGVTDLAGYYAGWWYILYSRDGSAASQAEPVSGGVNQAAINYGWSGAIPVPGDYDDDGKTDLAVYYPTDGLWYIRRSSDLQQVIIPWGWSQAWPVPGDYDGDGKTDIAVYTYATGTWNILYSDGGQKNISWGWAYGVPLPAYYSVNAQVDVAVLSITDYSWNVLSSRYGPLTPFLYGWNEAMPLYTPELAFQNWYYFPQ